MASLSHPAELSIDLLSKNRRKQRKKSHIAQILAKQRVEQLKNPDLYADGEILFCRVCEKSLDHSRKSTITRHFKSEFHIGNKKGGKENSKKNDAQNNTSTQNWCKTRKLENNFWPPENVCRSKYSVQRCRQPSRPRLFLEKYSRWRGHTPEWCFESLSFTVEKDRLENYKNSAFQLFTDETFDKEGRYVCSISFAVNPALGSGQIPFLAKTIFEPEPLNHSKVAQQIISTCKYFDIEFENICAFTTDNASYMRRAWNNCLKAVLPNAVHMSCIAHVMNTVIRDCMEPFEQIIDWASMISSFFVSFGSRKSQYFGFLKSIGVHPRMLPTIFARH